MLFHIQAAIADVQLRLLNLHQAVAVDVITKFAAVAEKYEIVFADFRVEADLAIIIARQLAVLFRAAGEMQTLLLQLQLL